MEQKPNKISFPKELLKNKLINIDSLEEALYMTFDEYFELATNSTDTEFYFANIFDYNRHSIYIEYYWKKHTDLIIVSFYNIFYYGSMPDNILDRINFLKENKIGLNTMLFKWE